MEWRKGSQLLTPSRYGRVILETTLNKKEDWFTVLIIRNLKESDSGDYTFTVKTGPATKAMTKSLVVIPKHGKDWTCLSEIPIFGIFLRNCSFSLVLTSAN